jgi:hypothetical protein
MAIPQHATYDCYGPVQWFDHEGQNLLKQQEVIQERGTYIWTVYCNGVYLPHYIGKAFPKPKETPVMKLRRFVDRFQEHEDHYKDGYNTVLDPTMLARGVCHELWESYLFPVKARLNALHPRPRGAERKALRKEYEKELIAKYKERRSHEFADPIIRMLQLFHIFFIPLPSYDVSRWLEGKLWRMLRADPQLVPFLARGIIVPRPAPRDQAPTITLRWPDGVRGRILGLENTERLELWI